MSDERDIYCDNRPINDLAYMWHSAAEFLFSDKDFYDRPLSSVHSIVRRKISEYHDSPTVQYLYAPATKVRSRLQLQGYTREKCIALWEQEHARHLLRLEEIKGHADDDFSLEIEAQRGLTFAAWEAREEARNSDHMFRWGGLHLFNFADTFAELALHIDTYKPGAVWADLSSFYADEFDPKLTLHENLRRGPAQHEVDLIEAVGDVLILTEGPSDTRILASEVQAMYPEYADMFSFVDFEEFKVEGGASPLTKMVRAFAGVRMSQRILALFDNDAAGHEQNTLLRRMKLPPNIKSMTLPDSGVAKRYPTIGPEGKRSMDINGSACSIELFLGRPSLLGEEGQLQPVRWSSWNKNAGRYQGELESKAAVTDKFINAMRSGDTPAKLKAKFKDMNDLLRAIFRAFD